MDPHLLRGVLCPVRDQGPSGRRRHCRPRGEPGDPGRVRSDLRQGHGPTDDPLRPTPHQLPGQEDQPAEGGGRRPPMAADHLGASPGHHRQQTEGYEGPSRLLLPGYYRADQRDPFRGDCVYARLGIQELLGFRRGAMVRQRCPLHERHHACRLVDNSRLELQQLYHLLRLLKGARRGARRPAIRPVGRRRPGQGHEGRGLRSFPFHAGFQSP